MKQKKMYYEGGRKLSLREYLERGELRAKKINLLIKQGLSDTEIAAHPEVGVSRERVRQIRNDG